jgi:hypothetical protein
MKQSATARQVTTAPSAAAPVVLPAAESDSSRARLARLAVFVAGVVATHFVLYAPSLLGFKVLLPLEDLGGVNTYLPQTPAYANVVARYPALSDQVLQFEFQRRFAAAELRAGRLPLWDPYNYCGAPFVVPFYSPYNLLYYLFPHYLTLAWTHVLVALVAAGGCYLFFRRVLEVGFWPAAVAAWCYPLTGFFQLWLGFYLSYTASFFPWLLLAVDATVRRPTSWGGPGVAVVTGLLLISGAPDLAGQALLAAGLFSLWQMGLRYREEREWRRVLAPAVVLTIAWVAGFLLASPYLWPLLEYMATGLRFQKRAGNVMEERPPVGITSLPHLLFPFLFGSTEQGWVSLTPAPNLQESAAQGYSGLIAALVLAPLGLASRRLRSLNLFWVLIAILASAWVLGLWPMTTLLRLRGLNLMSHNRFLFVFCFVVLALAAKGLDALARGEVDWHVDFRRPLLWATLFVAWCVISNAIVRYRQPFPGQDSSAVTQVLVLQLFGTAVAAAAAFVLLNVLPRDRRSALWIPVLLLIGLVVWCLDRTIEVASLVPDMAFKDRGTPADHARALQVARDYLQSYTAQAVAMGIVALAMWAVAYRAPRPRAVAILGLALVAELLWFQRNQNPQSDPALYYPPQPALVELSKAPPGRITGLSCLPPMLPGAYGLRDVRGYDAVDPARIVRLLSEVRYKSTPFVEYALTQWWILPLWADRRDGKFKCLPVLNMLNLRYVIGRGKPPDDEIKFEPLMINEGDYWVYENPNALPRVYVPKNVAAVSEAKALALMTDTNNGAAFQFDPRAVAFVEQDQGLRGNCEGSAEITNETPCAIHVRVDMKTPGLLVLADQWNPGWKAYLDGVETPIVLANYALRGVRLPAGSGEVVFRYQPASWSFGMRTFAVTAVVLVLWATAILWLDRRTKSHVQPS